MLRLVCPSGASVTGMFFVIVLSVHVHHSDHATHQISDVSFVDVIDVALADRDRHQQRRSQRDR
mgnify:CR=1 FL=1